jgi:hypothetical protein
VAKRLVEMAQFLWIIFGFEKGVDYTFFGIFSELFEVLPKF